MYSRRIIAPIVISTALMFGSGAAAFAAPSSSMAAPKLGRAGGLLTRIAAVEGVTPKILAQDLQQGQTLLHIAGSKYATAGDLATALLAPEKTRLDAAVSSQRLTAAQESTRYAALLSEVTTLVTTPHPLQAWPKALKHSAQVTVQRVVQEVAGACQTTPAALTTLLRAGGTSVLAACQTTNSAATQAQLTSLVLAPIKAKLDTAVANGKITAEQEQTAIAKADLAIGKALTKTLPARPAAHA